MEVQECGDWINDRNPREDGQYEVTFRTIDSDFISGMAWFTVFLPTRDREICGWDKPGVVAWRMRSKAWRPPT